MKIVKSSCTGKKKVRTCTFKPQVNIKNKREPIQTQEDINAAHSEAKIQDLIEDLKNVIYTKVKAVATSESFGFDEDEVNDYFFVDVTPTEIGEDHHEAVRVEVRAEVSYEGLEELMEALDPIIESYDSYAYFEPVEPGIIEAYVSVDQVDMSVYGATEDLTDLPENFQHAYTLAKNDFMNDYSSSGVEVYVVPDDFNAEDGEICLIVKGINRVGKPTQGKVYVYLDEEDPDVIYTALKETANALSIEPGSSDIESSNITATEDDKVFIEDIIDGLEENGYDTNNLSSIKEGLWALFGYQGKDANDIIEDLVAGGFIDSNVFIDSGRKSIYSDTEYDEEELQDIIDELTADGFDVTDEADLLMGLGADLGMDRADARYYAKLILNHMDDSSVLGAEEDVEDLPMVDQEYDSAATSINSSKLPAIYKMINLEPGTVTVDFGGGKFDNAVEYIRDKGATLVVYDPYNRSAEHNIEVLRILRENGGADAAVNSNVLNVIKEPEARKNVLENIARITKPGAPIYITVYEGKGNGQEGPTKSGYQLNRKTADYLEEIQEVFPDATRRGKLITAHNTGSVTSSTDDQSSSTILCSYDEFMTWYDDLSDEEQWKVDDIADTNGIPFYDEASDDELAWLHDVATIEIHASADHECSNWDEAVEWSDSYDGFEDENLKDVYSSDSIGNHMIITVNSGISGDGFSITVEDEQGDVVFNEEYRFGVNTSYDRKYAEMAEEDYQNAKKYGWSRIPELKPYVGDIIDDICNEYNIQKKDIVFKRGNNVFKGSEVTDNVVNDFIDSYINASYSIKGSFSDLEDEWLTPPEYDDPIEHEDSEELVEVELDQVITVDVDGDYEWDDDTYVWASPDESNEEWTSEDGVYIDDKVGVVEHIDDLIIPNVPTRPGKYRVTGLAELVYDVSGIQEYRTNYGPDDYDSDIDIDHAVVSFNFRKSEVQNLKITPYRQSI